MRSCLRRIFFIFNLGLVKRPDLNHLHQTQIAYQCLVHKLDFYLELRDRAQQNLDKYIKAPSYKLRTEAVIKETITNDITIQANMIFTVTADPF